MSRPVKRSFTIAGHRTSISLEAAFWDALKDIASAERVPVARLIARVDSARAAGGLSSAVRVWVLQHYREAARRGARGQG
jgi:predicted DNA-binding ribbon-helix-helix protein